MSTDVPEYYVTLSYLYGLFDYLAEQSLDVDAVLAAIDLDRDALANADTLLPADAIDIACNRAVELAGDPLFCFRAGQRMRPSHLGVVGHMLLCCRSIEDLALLITRYSRLISNGAEFEIVSRDDKLSLVIRVAPGRHKANVRTAHDYSVSGWIAMCQWLGGEKMSPRFMQFMGPEEVSYDGIREELGCDIRFDGEESIIAMDQGQRAFNLRQVDPEFRSTIEASLHKRLSLLDARHRQTDETLAGIADLICARLPDGAPALEDIAQQLGQTPRQLRYTLENRNTSFKALVESSRRAMALKHIADPTLPLVDVALLLGFSDQSTFHRAFKRWFDKSPGDFRKDTLAGNP